ncbi:hypothetical protein [Kitasatospora sp. NPDC057223]|uniref:hypothetical protein n=1 Tax=Kitasatospora sp. NPDC057223 TaxID=3346055 RepID=UPI003628E432
MRLRNAAIAAASAVTLVLAIPGSASATVGEFRYTYRDAGAENTGWLVDPPSGHCINLDEATDEEPAYAPKNWTVSAARVFLGSDCDEAGPDFVLRPGGGASDRLLVRSVRFS